MCGDWTVVGGWAQSGGELREEAPAIVQVEDDSGLDQGGGMGRRERVSLSMYSQRQSPRGLQMDGC